MTDWRAQFGAVPPDSNSNTGIKPWWKLNKKTVIAGVIYSMAVAIHLFITKPSKH